MDVQADKATKSTAGNIDEIIESTGAKQDVDHHGKGTADTKTSKPASKSKFKSRSKRCNEKPSSKSGSKHGDDLSVSSQVSHGSKTASGSDHSSVSLGHRHDTDSCRV